MSGESTSETSHTARHRLLARARTRHRWVHPPFCSILPVAVILPNTQPLHPLLCAAASLHPTVCVWLCRWELSVPRDKVSVSRAEWQTLLDGSKKCFVEFVELNEKAVSINTPVCQLLVQYCPLFCHNPSENSGSFYGSALCVSLVVMRAQFEVASSFLRSWCCVCTCSEVVVCRERKGAIRIR